MELDKIFETLLNELPTLSEKQKFLEKADKEELQQLLDGEDPTELCENKGIARMFLTDYDEAGKKELLDKIFAFMDAHPIYLKKAAEIALQEENIKEIRCNMTRKRSMAEAGILTDNSKFVNKSLKKDKNESPAKNEKLSMYKSEEEEKKDRASKVLTEA